MLKTLTIAGGLLAASLSFAPQQASAAALGSGAALGDAVASSAETVQYGYGYGHRRGYYGPRRGYRRGFYGPGYGRRRFYRRRFGY